MFNFQHPLKTYFHVHWSQTSFVPSSIVISSLMRPPSFLHSLLRNWIWILESPQIPFLWFLVIFALWFLHLLCPWSWRYLDNFEVVTIVNFLFVYPSVPWSSLAPTWYHLLSLFFRAHGFIWVFPSLSSLLYWMLHLDHLFQWFSLW